MKSEVTPRTKGKYSGVKDSAIFLSAIFIVGMSSSAPAHSTDEAPKSVPGPAKISLGSDLAIIDLPKGYGFVDAEQAKEILRANGSSAEGVLGIIAPKSKDQETKQNDFFIVCKFEDIGHVRDDDANKLDADKILESYKEGTKAQNEERKQQNIPPIFVAGWAERPRYDKDKHQVIWALAAKDVDSDSAPVTTINYNTRILGRKGVLSLNLVTDPDQLSTNKAKTATLLDRTTFNRGQSYGDFIAGRDKDSGMGITGLILGGGALAAAAKFGLLGGAWKMIVALTLAFKKFIIVGVVGLGAMFSKLFGKKKDGY